jgi:hypothetical protein
MLQLGSAEARFSLAGADRSWQFTCLNPNTRHWGGRRAKCHYYDTDISSTSLLFSLFSVTSANAPQRSARPPTPGNHVFSAHINLYRVRQALVGSWRFLKKSTVTRATRILLQSTTWTSFQITFCTVLRGGRVSCGLLSACMHCTAAMVMILQSNLSPATIFRNNISPWCSFRGITTSNLSESIGYPVAFTSFPF